MQLLTADEADQIALAIARAEAVADGEIRVAIIPALEGVPVLDEAANQFRALEMHKTFRRNGVLILMAPNDRQFAIIGDEGIDRKVPADFWDAVKNEMQQHLVAGNYYQALLTGVEQAGAALARHFKRVESDINELPDTVVFVAGKNEHKQPK